MTSALQHSLRSRKHCIVEEEEADVTYLLVQARKYRELGNAVRDRATRLALLELAFDYEERARQLLASGGSGSVHEEHAPPPMAQQG